MMLSTILMGGFARCLFVCFTGSNGHVLEYLESSGTKIMRGSIVRKDWED